MISASSSFDSKSSNRIPFTVPAVPTGMHAGVAAGGDDDVRRRPHADLRDVLHVQARTLVRLCRGNTASLSDFSFKEFIQTGCWHADVAGFVDFYRQWQKFLHSLSAQR